MNIYEAIADIMREGYAITKSKKNQKQGFMYRGIDDVLNTFQPLMAARGIFVVPEVLEHSREERQTSNGGNLIYSILKIRYTFYASDGTNVSAVVIGEGMDSGDKASNKALAVAMKYAMFQVFCIPTEELVDPDSETPPPTHPAPKSEKTAGCRCEQCGKELKSYKATDGKTISVEAHAKRSNQRFGKTLCLDCINEMLKK